MKKRNKNKSRKSKKTKKGGKSRRTRRTRRTVKKGGALYGTGVGANCYDPNFSIYNTRELELFPYNPTKIN